MRLIPLSEIPQMSPGEQVICTKGRVKTILDHHEGAKEDGSTWSFQKVILTDGKAEVTAKVWDYKDATGAPAKIPPAWKGKEIYLSCTMGGNNRWNGIKTKTDTYKGQDSIILNVSDAARLDLAPPPELGGAPATPAAAPVASAPANTPPPPPPPAPVTPPAASAPAPQAPAAPAPASNGNSKLDDVKRAIFQRASLWGICRVMAEKEAEHLKASAGIELSADQKAAMVSSLFISADRDRLHYDMPLTHVDFTPKKSK